MKIVRLIKTCLNETYNVCISKYLSDNSLIQNGLKQAGTLLQLLLNFAVEYAIRKLEKNELGLKLNGTRHLLAEADDGR
jgi:hypothetical protein